MRDKFRPRADGAALRAGPSAAACAGRWPIPQVRVIDGEQDSPPAGQFLPVYPLTEGLPQRHVRKLVRGGARRPVSTRSTKSFPPEYLEPSTTCCRFATALPQIHFPASRAELEQARRRFIYQELFVLQLALALKRQQVHDHAARRCRWS